MAEEIGKQIQSLQPGFLVVTYDPAEVGFEQCAIDADLWKQMKEGGFYGGLIVQKGVEFQSLDDEQLEELGLMRIER